ncbi:MAG: hypothetical protein IRY90_00580 [Actinomadura rubrobrunea]|nr:hypothetical protein [Actinomadura rubrobrunea]
MRTSGSLRVHGHPAHLSTSANDRPAAIVSVDQLVMAERNAIGEVVVFGSGKGAATLRRFGRVLLRDDSPKPPAAVGLGRSHGGRFIAEH